MRYHSEAWVGAGYMSQVPTDNGHDITSARLATRTRWTTFGWWVELWGKFWDFYVCITGMIRRARVWLHRGPSEQSLGT